MTAEFPTDRAAIDALTKGMPILIGSFGVLTAMLILSHRMRRPTWWWDAVTLLTTFVAVLTLCWIVFNPAIYAIGPVSGPMPFVVVGTLLGSALFYLRTVRKDLYGTVEIAVAIATLVFVGSHYSPSNLGPSVIGFVGAVYVLVRGLTNIAETLRRP